MWIATELMKRLVDIFTWRDMSKTKELPKPMKPAVFLTRREGYVIGVYIHSVKTILTRTKEIPLVECTAWKYFVPHKSKK